MELGSYTERQRHRDPLNPQQQQQGYAAAFPHRQSPPRGLSSSGSHQYTFYQERGTLRSAFAGGGAGGIEGEGGVDGSGWPGHSSDVAVDAGAAGSSSRLARDALPGSYSPYDVAYRGQAYADNAFDQESLQPPQRKHHRGRLLLVALVLAILSVCFLLRHRAGLQSAAPAVSDPCVLDKEPACTVYPFFDGFNEAMVQMVDADTGTGNFLFRSSLPLGETTGRLLLDELTATMRAAAEAKSLQLPQHFRTILISLEWGESNGHLLEQCELAREACQARSSPQTATVHWPVYGQRVSPFALPSHERDALASNFTAWDGDNLEQKVQVLYHVTHRFLEVASAGAANIGAPTAAAARAAADVGAPPAAAAAGVGSPSAAAADVGAPPAAAGAVADAGIPPPFPPAAATAAVEATSAGVKGEKPLAGHLTKGSSRGSSGGRGKAEAAQEHAQQQTSLRALQGATSVDQAASSPLTFPSTSSPYSSPSEQQQQQVMVTGSYGSNYTPGGDSRGSPQTASVGNEYTTTTSSRSITGSNSSMMAPSAASTPGRGAAADPAAAVKTPSSGVAAAAPPPAASLSPDGAPAAAAAEETPTIPLVSVVHCHHGKDRTGLLVGAYKLRFLRYSLQQVIQENLALGQNLVEAFNALMWYCLYLEKAAATGAVVVEGPALAGLHLKCFDVIAAYPGQNFVSNGRAPRTPPGVLPPDSGVPRPLRPVDLAAARPAAAAAARVPAESAAGGTGDRQRAAGAAVEAGESVVGPRGRGGGGGREERSFSASAADMASVTGGQDGKQVGVPATASPITPTLTSPVYPGARPPAAASAGGEGGLASTAYPAGYLPSAAALPAPSGVAGGGETAAAPPVSPQAAERYASVPGSVGAGYWPAVAADGAGNHNSLLELEKAPPQIAEGVAAAPAVTGQLQAAESNAGAGAAEEEISGAGSLRQLQQHSEGSEQAQREEQHQLQQQQHNHPREARRL